jgi:hypothetical protein
MFHEADNLNISSQFYHDATSILSVHKQELCMSENNFPHNSQFKYNYFKIKCRINSVFWKRSSNVLKSKRDISYMIPDCGQRMGYQYSAQYQRLEAIACGCIVVSFAYHKCYFIHVIKHLMTLIWAAGTDILPVIQWLLPPGASTHHDMSSDHHS